MLNYLQLQLYRIINKSHYIRKAACNWNIEICFTLFILFLFTSWQLNAQSNDFLLRFKDSTTKSFGYKDIKGKIIILPILERFTTADTFYNIIQAHQKSGFSEETYFLFRNGKKIKKYSGIDFDFNYDCESEGKIIFRDIKQDRVGYLGKDGTIVIPAIYNNAHPFFNNMAIVSRNAKKQCDTFGEDTATCENYSWVDGETVLINPKNEVLISNIKGNTNNLNWFSKTINQPLSDSSIIVSFKATDSSIYSFIDYEKEFKKWFETKFIQMLNQENDSTLKECFFPVMKYWVIKSSKWTNISEKDFLIHYPQNILKYVFKNDHVKQITISAQPLNQLVFKEKEYRNFFNSCGTHNKEQYPLFDVVISTYKKRKKNLTSKLFSDFDKSYALDYQENFDFIRTKNNYKLLEVTIR